MKPSSPKHKRLKRPERLKSARRWLPKYTGKNIVKGYSKHFAVDKICAVIELRMLGYKISDQYLEQLKANLVVRQKAKERRKREKELNQIFDLFPESDDVYYYIAGYTANGVPYGCTWEEIEQESENFPQQLNSEDENEYEDSEDVPF